MSIRGTGPAPLPHRIPGAPPAALAVLAGACLAYLLPWLPSPAWLVAAVGALLLALLACPGAAWPLRILLLGLLGLAWSSLHGAWVVGQRPPATPAVSEAVAEVRVLGLPEAQPGRLRMDVRVERLRSGPARLDGARLRLSWYGRVEPPAPGSRWLMTLRLRAPRGLANPGGFDTERFALERRLAAVGHVREARPLDPASAGIDAIRARISAAVAARVEPTSARFLCALAVADTRAIDDDDWDVLRATGTTHLIAISGLHVGMVAGFGALLARLPYRVLPRLALRLPLPAAAALAALAAGTAYTALAGFELPTVRTLLMIAAGLLAVLLRRARSAWQALALAALAVVAIDPLAPLSPGFWLSFVGVAWLLGCLPAGRGGRGLAGLLRAQLLMTLGLMPLTVWFFGEASIAGALVNLLAVPWISLLVVPLTLVGTGMLAVHDGLGALVLALAARSMELAWLGLAWAADWPAALLRLPEPGLPALALGLAGCLWCTLPRGTPGRLAALPLLAALLLPARDRPPPGALDLWVLDVGQGLAVVLHTRERTWLVDTGPSFRHGGDSAGSVVLPALRAIGVEAPELLVLSHGDDDHAGAAATLRAAFPGMRVLSGEPRRTGADGPCRAGEAFADGAVRARFLHPPRHFPELGNASSCVLRVEVGGHAALLPGDIDAVVEARLLETRGAGLRAELLVAPHHGSRSSSSEAFVAAVAPRRVAVSAGHGHRFGHPAPEVVARYGRIGASIDNSAVRGALHYRLDANGPRLLQHWRGRAPRYWRERG